MQRLLRSRHLFPFLSPPPHPRSNSPPSVCHLALGKRLASAMAIEYTPAEWEQVSKENVPPYSVYKLPIVKSERDDREYRVIKLENGLEATLVHDAKAERAAASLDVAVGHLSDPVSLSDSRICSHDMYYALSRTICQDWHTFASTCSSWYVVESKLRSHNLSHHHNHILGH